MKQAQFLFSAELNDFLPENRKQQVIRCPFNGNQSVKHLIESLGVPHTEINQILVNREPVDFSYLVEDGDQIQIFPISEQSKGSPPGLQNPLPDEQRFVLDNHLGRLAVYLRMLGFDSLYRNDYQDDELARVSSQENRILLTRDVRLLMRSQVTRGYWVRSKAPRKQIVEVARRFDLSGDIRPFQRCMRCNGLLQPVSKEAILDRLQPLTKQYFNEFHICPDCNQVYWKGSHYERMQQLIELVIQQVED